MMGSWGRLGVGCLGRTGVRGGVLMGVLRCREGMGGAGNVMEHRVDVTGNRIDVVGSRTSVVVTQVRVGRIRMFGGLLGGGLGMRS